MRTGNAQLLVSFWKSIQIFVRLLLIISDFWFLVGVMPASGSPCRIPCRRSRSIDTMVIVTRWEATGARAKKRWQSVY